MQGTGGLTIPNHTGFDLGSGNFTVELFFYQLTINTFPNLINKCVTVNFSPFNFTLSTGREIYSRSSNNGTSYVASILSATSAYTTTAWHHLAWVRSGTTFYAWLNGVSLGTPVTMSGALTTNSDPLTIGTGGSGGNYFNGRISSVRLTKGTARYTAAFTPPTLPFPTS